MGRGTQRVVVVAITFAGSPLWLRVYACGLRPVVRLIGHDRSVRVPDADDSTIQCYAPNQHVRIPGPLALTADPEVRSCTFRGTGTIVPNTADRHKKPAQRRWEYSWDRCADDAIHRGRLHERVSQADD
jgi:hypothetical protein